MDGVLRLCCNVVSLVGMIKLCGKMVLLDDVVIRWCG